MISTWRNAQREREYRALVKDLEEKKKETEGSNRSEEMESVRSGDDDDFEREEKLKALHEDISNLEKEVASFGHVQGCHTPFAELIDPGKTLGAGWTKVCIYHLFLRQVCIIFFLLSRKIANVHCKDTFAPLRYF